MVTANKKTKKRTRKISNGAFSDEQQTAASNLVQPIQDLTATRDEVNRQDPVGADSRLDDQYTGSRTDATQQGSDNSAVHSKAWPSAAPSPEPPNPGMNDPYRGARGVNNDVPDMGDIYGKSQPNQPGNNNPPQPVVPAVQVPDPNEQPRVKPGDESFGDFSFGEGAEAGADPSNWNASGIGQVVNKTTEEAMKGVGAAGVTPPGGQAGAGAPAGTGAKGGAGQAGADAPGTEAGGAGQQGGELTWDQLARDLGLSIGGTIANRTPYLANGDMYAGIAGQADAGGAKGGAGQAGADAPGTEAAGTGNGGAKDGSETGGAKDGIDAWTDQANQTWQGFLDWEKRRQEQMKKEQNRSAWYNLMSKGLIGAANLAGTINGAPSLQLDMSVDEKNDPYARMKEDRTYMAGLVNKRIEQINKEREAYRKAKNDLANITLKRQSEERLYTDTMSRIKEREAKAVLDQDKANLAAEARKEQQRHNMAMEEFKQEEIALKREMSQYDKTLKQSQASRNNRSGGSGRSGSGDKTARRQVLDDNFVADVKAMTGSRYRELSGYRRGDRSNETQKAINALKAWIKSNPNDVEAKKLLEDYNKKKSNL